jgi:hypothetical protein
LPPNSEPSEEETMFIGGSGPVMLPRLVGKSDSLVG